MKLSELKTIINSIDDDRLDREVVISVTTVGYVGGTPTVKVKNVFSGFDWDNGKLIICPEVKLREINKDEIETLKKNYDELGWKKYKIDDLKRENKKLKKELTECERQRMYEYERQRPD